MPLQIRHLSPQDVLGHETTLWKYLSFEKFLDFLLLKRLYFRRSDKLSDPFECLVPPEMRSPCTAIALPPEELDLLAAHERYINSARPKVFLNSWHINEYESEAMWKLFGGQGHSIAIRTTFGRMLAQLAAHDLTAGKVLYKDMIKDDCRIADLFDFALLKRKPFEHEREFRLIYINEQGDENPRLLDGLGLHIPVEPAALMDAVYVSPLSEPWQFELTQTIVTGQGLSDRLIRSTLFNLPGTRR
ncbi:hypothetical protein NNJEOMEG_01815 [Fundidesulfovibrio magnetotacticus]|uniref:DUF2971 domain-containing protein n=1 Tax=Fundidesulfovibrio magnetotacticus TaxID=2730080 RepID=A0A6V8LWE2_9BACT|nr:hypothetical protein [Fundidesulfovibrio magnetotacticus]GFK93977.1 hypothetical protein NNJEOMEG_01815 [Fundidesulfovibrio magnetotacticus]